MCCTTGLCREDYPWQFKKDKLSELRDVSCQENIWVWPLDGNPLNKASVNDGIQTIFAGAFIWNDE